MAQKSYDIIIAGGGLSGLSLAYRAFTSGVWKDEKVLIVDKVIKVQNDRTWCFWEKQVSPFEDIIHKTWSEFLFFSNQGQNIPMDTHPYVYKMIRASDFYQYTINYLSSIDSVTFLQGDIQQIDSTNSGCEVVIDGGAYRSTYVFNSIYKKPEKHTFQQYFLQHFKGLVIETDVFKGCVDQIHFMDYRTSQRYGLAFVYVLPISEKKILVEYTLFSEKLLGSKTYDEELQKYISEILKIEDYKVLEQEFGVIPMTDHVFKRRNGFMMNIGTAGGDTRGSSGYTYMNVQHTITAILESYKQYGTPFFSKEKISLRHKLYDQTILNVFKENSYKGDLIFTHLFKKTKASDVFRFLDGEGSVFLDFKIMKSLRVLPFVKAFTKVLVYRFKNR